MDKNQTALTISKKDALRLFPTASPEFKVMLISTFGEKFFSQDVLDRLKDGDIEDCYDLTGLPKISHVSEIPEKFHEFIKDTYENLVMFEAFNEGDKLSFLDENQQKHYPYFRVSSGGLAFCYTNFNFSVACAGGASRLRVKSEKAARIMGNNPNFQKVIFKMLEH